MTKAKVFNHLFQPGIIANIELKNRIIKAPTTEGMAGMDGSVTLRLIKHYKEVAMGGCAMVIAGFAWVDNDASKACPCQTGVANDEHIPGLAWLAQTIQQNGAKACLQIEHCGRQKFLGTPPIKAPSRVPWEELVMMGSAIPEELTFEEIQGIVEAFGDAARRTMKAGFDMVEIHGAHGYLITNFLSPRTNKRTDWYGGSLENRMRFLLELVYNIRSKVGPDYPVGVRLSGTEYEPDGVMIEETIQVAKALEKAGVNYIHVSGGNHHQMAHEVTPMYLSLAHNVWAAEAIKKEVSLPVIASGSITSPELAEEILASGKGDFVGLGRPLFADPYFPKKAQQGRPEDIAPCIRCNSCLERGLASVGFIRCTVNVALGKEDEYRITSAERAKKVAIVGGGPAGMEAARVAAMRGHQVTLYEKEKLGGLLNPAAVPDFKADLRPLIKYFTTQIEKLKVKVVNEEATPEKIKSGQYDSLILAMGGVPTVPKVPGIDKPFVVSATGALSGEAKIGDTVAVIGGGLVGAETAWHIARQGKKVIILVRRDEFATDIPSVFRQILLEDIENLGVEVYTGKLLTRVADGEVAAVDRFGNETIFKVDSVVIARGYEANKDLIQKYKEVCDEVYVAGDCLKPRLIFDAIHEGNLAARWL